MTRGSIGISCTQHDTQQRAEQQQWTTFDIWFSRCQNTRHFLAGLILGDSGMAKDAVENCRTQALGSLPCFESEGAFRSWLARVLIEEAITMREITQTVSGLRG